MHLLHFRSCFYYQAEEIASVSFSLIKKKSRSWLFFSPHFFLHFFHTEERVMNELCLCEVAEIHFIVSNIDFCAGRSLMSLHVLDVVCVCFCVCMLYPDCACESISLSKFLCFQVHVMCKQSVGMSVEHAGPHLQRCGQQRGWFPHHQAPSG